MPIAELLPTQVDLGGLMEVLGQHLYSTPLVAVRELVQNAHDSCLRRRVEDDVPPAPVIRVQPEPGVLSIIDNGAGLTREEILRYLATAGSGYTRRLREAEAEGPGWGEAAPIGQFGLGFLSAFFVSERVEVWTTSYQDPTVGWRFLARGAERFQLEQAPPRPVGTEVRLHLSPRHTKLGELDTLQALLWRYTRLLPFPVHLGAGPPVNAAPPPWRPGPAPTDPLDPANLAFAASFEPSFQPLCTFPLPAGGPVRGLLWVQSGGSWATSDNRHVSVFVRGMLISDDARDLLPRWAGFCGAVLESDRLRPTASREDLQRDEAWEEVRSAVQATLVDGLAHLVRRAPSAWSRVQQRHAEALLGAAVGEDTLFEALADELKVPTSEGDWTLAALRRHNRRQGREGRLYASLGQRGSYEEMLFRAMKVPVIEGTRFAALPFARRYARRAGLELVHVGTREGDAALFRPTPVDEAATEALEECFGGEGREVRPVSFAPSWLPLVLVPDREAEIKHRIESDEMEGRLSTSLLKLARLHTATLQGEVTTHVYVNLACPAVQALLAAPPEGRLRAGRLLRAAAELMGGHEEHTAVDIEGSLRELGALACELAGAPPPPSH